MMTRNVLPITLLTLLIAAPATPEILTRGGKLAVDAHADGRLLFDLVGNLWVVPLGGGEAQALDIASGAASRPRWSPDGSRVLYVANTDGRQGLRIHDLGTGEVGRVGSGAYLDLYAAWHPGGERVAFSSDRRESGLDVWEADLPSGLEWRLTNRPGDETEPAWSADGRDLVYVHRDGKSWSLVLREHGQAEEILVTGDERIAGPSWRPDGTLVTFWRETREGWSLDMVILSEPRLVRQYANGEAFATTPVSWLDKHRMFYAAGGRIRQRLFNSWSSMTVPFRATVEAQPVTTVERVRRTLARIDEPRGTLVIHAARLFDGIVGKYQLDLDIVMDGGRIRSVEPHRDRPGDIVIDMGDLVVMPGIVDVHARLPASANEASGPLLLAAGLTTVVAEHAQAEHLNTVWSGKDVPGPRLLPVADWPVDRYSELADKTTPGLELVLQSRAARLIGVHAGVPRRFSETPRIDHGLTDVVLGSHGSGLPAGIGAQAELLALAAAGLKPEQALRAAGVNAAAALGVDPNLGRVATGAAADLVFVEGDPLNSVEDAIAVVAVVRNGRFFSVAGLIDRSADAETVE
ncbi:MAG: amidohydrolase family protein [Woeseiaceae bacterium]|nr:amidohydrolase family protein [Woeseiaceae bacterium]